MTAPRAAAPRRACTPSTPWGAASATTSTRSRSVTRVRSRARRSKPSASARAVDDERRIGGWSAPDHPHEGSGVEAERRRPTAPTGAQLVGGDRAVLARPVGVEGHPADGGRPPAPRRAVRRLVDGRRPLREEPAEHRIDTGHLPPSRRGPSPRHARRPGQVVTERGVVDRARPPDGGGTVDGCRGPTTGRPPPAPRWRRPDGCGGGGRAPGWSGGRSRRPPPRWWRGGAPSRARSAGRRGRSPRGSPGRRPRRPGAPRRWPLRAPGGPAGGGR